jgi:hypothetical protein
MPQEESINASLAHVLRIAYQQFKGGEPRAALDVLMPVLETEESASQPSLVAATLWGLAGDCYFQLGEPEPGFHAYKRSIALTPYAGCLELFACQVAKHRRAEDAAFALRCLAVAREGSRKGFKEHPLFVLWHSLSWDLLFLRYVRLPIVRWRLRRLAARSADTN